ncbi:phosphotransferase [Streptomyces sp. NPDC056949]|uniref:phosphotransferase n=1 Tax=Streptomyces sp. NPDC056949 TaxID=3345976 RepID=UPI003635ED22
MTTIMNEKELSACLHSYGLKPFGTARALPGGHVGSTALVPTDQGPLVVKRLGARFDLARVQLSAEAHRHAALAGLAPRSLYTSDGHLTAFLDGASYLLTEYVEAAEPPARNDLAHALAKLHAHFNVFRPDSDCTDFIELPEPPASGLEEVLRQTRDTAVRGAVDRRLRILAKYGLKAHFTTALPLSWIHGDAGPDNLLTARAPGRPLFIDFDQVSRFPRPYEIARAFIATVTSPMSPQELRSAFHRYLGAYQAITPISAEDRSLMTDLYIMVQASETRSFTTPEGEVRGMRDFTLARHRQLAWIVRHRDLLHDTAREAGS